MTQFEATSDTATLALKTIEFNVQDEDNSIKAVASTLNGKEYIYFNDILIHESRNIGFSSKYAYEAGGSLYEFRFIMTLRSVEFLTLKNDCLIYSETISLRRQQKWGFIIGVAAGILGAALGYSLASGLL
ncbi:hypothetical protein QGN29_00630 [Temperatibacter marinus]|uniref:Uncharacterized protein n=1 Tax=Temperatibacter marinus TaxID=1456591 RepID=A0AA52EDN4_9PROT|nr:hypothetical protein [Temperatibacter marinus]WND02866.1 hypothetical protein QGN29_00630 [Temperatibacter marinus]